jgi:hypothetical protein
MENSTALTTKCQLLRTTKKIIRIKQKMYCNHNSAVNQNSEDSFSLQETSCFLNKKETIKSQVPEKIRLQKTNSI